MTEATCSGGCGTVEVLPENGTLPPGWEQLSITGRLRCGACWRALKAAQQHPGTPSAYAPDPLPADDIGSLKKLPVRQPFHEGVKP